MNKKQWDKLVKYTTLKDGLPEYSVYHFKSCLRIWKYVIVDGDFKYGIYLEFVNGELKHKLYQSYPNYRRSTQKEFHKMLAEKRIKEEINKMICD